MNGIFHRVVIQAKPNAVYNALTTDKGLSNWWTKSDAQPKVDTTARFYFEGVCPPIEMKIDKLENNKHVKWQCIAGPDDWINSNILFDIQPGDADDSVVLFRHADWKQESEFTAHCSMKWATFLCSLKDLMETGIGRPFPNDLAV